jgi:hypothetical protein
MGSTEHYFSLTPAETLPSLRERYIIVGERVLEAAPYSGKSPEAVVWLQATRMGAFAYQLPGADSTIFGQALLEALEGQPPDDLPYDRSVIPWRLIFGKLEAHVKQRVRELLKQYNATKIQPVEPGGYPYNGDVLVAEKSPSVAVGLPLPPPAAPPHGRTPEEPLAAGAIDLPIRQLIDERASAALDMFTTGLPGGAPRDLADVGAMHDVFGNESVTGLWVRTLRVLDIDNGQPVPPGIVTVWRGQRQEGQKILTVWLDLLVKPRKELYSGRAVWIQAGSDHGPSVAVAVPRDSFLPTPIRLDLTFKVDNSGETWSLEAMTARLAPPPIGDLQIFLREIWGLLWEVQRVETFADLAQASRAVTRLGILGAAAKANSDSPVAAAIGAALLLRAGALDSLHDWPRRLATYFSWLPDGAILWAETLLRRDEAFWKPPEVDRPSLAEARSYFVWVNERGPPLLTSVLSMAGRQASLWRRVLNAKGIEGDERIKLQTACEVIEHTETYAVSDGVFAAFMRPSAKLTLNDVFRPRNAVTRQPAN